MKAVHKKRLLNVARALEESPKPNAFTMTDFAQQCGTPACALGHYCSRRDLQKAFKLGGNLVRLWPVDIKQERAIGISDRAITEHFGLSNDEDLLVSENEELFGPEGCGGAKTAKQAARYIRKFVARKEREAKR